jgi:Htaa
MGVPLPSEPARLARPASAVAMVDAAVTWHVRDSFVQYPASGGGAGTASAGATAGAPQVRPGSDTPLVYEFGFTPAATGWYDPASGQAAVSFTGTVRFLFPGRFDFTASDPERRESHARLALGVGAPPAGGDQPLVLHAAGERGDGSSGLREPAQALKR